MRVAIIGAGPAGLFLGSALAGRGHDVVAVDRDTRPPSGRWRRPGVMQFHHAHAFRQQVGMALRREWPSALDAWLALGAEPISFDLPGVGPVPAGHRSRRETFERALRTTAEIVPGLSIRQGHVDGVLSAEGRVVGIVVDGSPVQADLSLAVLRFGLDVPDPDGSLALRYGVGVRGAVLVRPDGFVAWQAPNPSDDRASLLRSAVQLATGRAEESAELSA
jgi:hypothetical protein